MISERLFKWLLSAAIFLTGVHLFITGAISPDKVMSITAPMGVVSAIILGFFGLLNNHLWKWFGIHSLVKAPPVITGTWKGTYLSTYIDPNTRAPATGEIFAVVHQTLSTVEVTMFTDKMASHTVAATVTKESNSLKIVATYQSVPHLNFRANSEIHFGGFLMTISGSTPNKLDGHYWTDRNSRGTLTFDKKHNDLADSFDTAKALLS